MTDILGQLRGMLNTLARITHQLTGKEQWAIDQEIQALQWKVAQLADSVTLEDLLRWNDLTPQERALRKKAARKADGEPTV